jgi:hypothetical protein
VKRTVLVLSIIAPVLMFAIGGFFFAASGFGIDFEAPPTSPQRIVGALIGYIPGLVLTLIALALSLSATARSRQTGWFAGLLLWPIAPVLAAVLMVTGTVGFSESWWLAAVFLPLSTLIYGAIGPAPVTNGRPQGASESSNALAPLLAFVGVLALVTVLGFTSLVRGALPFTSPPAATPTIGPAALSVRMGDGAANCATGSYPEVTITNTTQQTVGWSASVNGAGVTVTPASGRLDAGASTTVTISGQAATTPSFTIFFATSGAPSDPALAKIACVSK